MDIIRVAFPFDTALDVSRQAMAIGYFDGVHPGHRQVIQRAAELAKQDHISSSIMTFEPHPREVLGKQKLQYITPVEEKLKRFAECGIDRTYILTFNPALSLLKPEQFVTDVLYRLSVDTVVVGFNFTFGHLGRGNVEMLRDIGAERMKVVVVRPYHIEGMRVSSTMIREKLLAGHVEKGAQLLGRAYSIEGEVVRGKGRGSTIGVPTANLQLSEPYLIPRNGVYAVHVIIEDKRYGGVMNIGYKPTFDDHLSQPTLEVHLFGFNRSIYGKRIRVEFEAYMREEQKFDSVDRLIAQIQADIVQAQAITSFTSKS